MSLSVRNKVLRGPQPILKSSSPIRSISEKVISTPIQVDVEKTIIQPIKSLSQEQQKQEQQRQEQQRQEQQDLPQPRSKPPSRGTYDRPTYERQPYKQSYEKPAYEKQAYEKQAYERAVPTYERQPPRMVQKKPMEETFEKEEYKPLVVLDQNTVNQIISHINSLIPEGYSVIEGSSDLGPLSKGLISSPLVSKIVTFMSGNKSEDFRLAASKGKKSEILDENFKYSPALDSPYILFFYPNLLIDNYSKLSASKSVPDLFHIVINDLTFSQILENELGGYHVGPKYVMMVTPKIVVPNQPKWKVKSIPIGNYVLHIVENQISTSKKKTYQLVDPRNEKEWRKNLRLFLIDVLTPIYGEKYSLKLLEEDTFDIWVNAFTHETFDLNNNYEQLETIGDRVLELPFVRYILNLFPSLTSQEITLIKSKYMSKVFQGTTARKLGFGPWIRIAEGLPNVSILEDSFEAFFGALDAVGEQKLGPGFGFILTMKFLNYLFKDIVIDPREGKTAKSQIKEIFEKLNWGKGGAREETMVIDNGYLTNIYMTEDAKNSLIQRGKMKPTNSLVLASGFGSTKKVSASNAYQNAIRLLESMDITYDSAKLEKEINDLIRAGATEQNIEKMNELLEAKGFDKFEFFTSKTTSTQGGYLLQLIGVKYDEDTGKIYREILVSKRVEDLQQGKYDILTEFLKNN